MPNPDPHTVTVGEAGVPAKVTAPMVGAAKVVWVAPMLQLPPGALATACWSVVGQTWVAPTLVSLGMAPTAGLSESGRMVWVNPWFCLRAPMVTSRLADR